MHPLIKKWTKLSRIYSRDAKIVKIFENPSASYITSTKRRTKAI